MISEKRSMTHTERRKPYDFFMKHFLGIDLFSPQDLDKLNTIDRQIASRKFSVPKKLMTIAITLYNSAVRIPYVFHVKISESSRVNLEDRFLTQLNVILVLTEARG